MLLPSIPRGCPHTVCREGLLGDVVLGAVGTALPVAALQEFYKPGEDITGIKKSGFSLQEKQGKGQFGCKFGLCMYKSFTAASFP